MNIRRALLSLPLKKQTAIGALIMTTILYLVYQFIFVAELTESSKPQKRDDEAQQAARHRHAGNQGIVQKRHPKDVRSNKVDGISDGKAEFGPERNDQGNSGGRENINSAWRIANPQNNNIDVNKANLMQESKVTFQCEKSGKTIAIKKLNDNYCDCPEDGSDEPKTNACANGKFTCIKHVKPFPDTIPSGWVNDGVCDCCDGSDEWKMKRIEAKLPVKLQRRIGRFLSPCPDQCPDAL